MTTKIAVISDTHIDDRISSFPAGLLKQLRGFDIVIHCGDFTTREALEKFDDFPKFYAVAGNMDEPYIRRNLPETLALEIAGVRVGVIHGWGSPFGFTRRIYAAMREKHPDVKFDIILCGHSHQPADEEIDGTRILNPGSVAGNIFSKHGSWGELEISESSINWTIHKIERTFGGII